MCLSAPLAWFTATIMMRAPLAWPASVQVTPIQYSVQVTPTQYSVLSPTPHHAATHSGCTP